MSKDKRVQRSKRWRYADRKAPREAVVLVRCLAANVVVRGAVVSRKL
jgi:hypothetical protein